MTARATGGALVSWQDERDAEVALLATPFTDHWLALGDRRLDLSARVPGGRDGYRFRVRLASFPRIRAWLLGAPAF